MKFHPTKIKGAYLIDFEPYVDGRGYFLRTFCKNENKNFEINKFVSDEISFDIVQVNRSFTKKKGTVRGLHFQEAPHAEDKIIQCLGGEIYDVVLDLRKNSDTFKKWISVKLTDKKKQALLVPKGCANGFQTMKNNCLIEYFMSEFYYPESGNGVRWNDPAFKIKWPIKKPFLSEKDKNWPNYKNPLAIARGTLFPRGARK